MTGTAELQRVDTGEYFEVPARIRPPGYHGRTVSGYGAAMPTRYMVYMRGRWRRVYAACYGNAASFYVGTPGAWEATVVDVSDAT